MVLAVVTRPPDAYAYQDLQSMRGERALSTQTLCEMLVDGEKEKVHAVTQIADKK